MPASPASIVTEVDPMRMGRERYQVRATASPIIVRSRNVVVLGLPPQLHAACRLLPTASGAPDGVGAAVRQSVRTTNRRPSSRALHVDVRGPAAGRCPAEVADEVR